MQGKNYNSLVQWFSTFLLPRLFNSVVVTPNHKIMVLGLRSYGHPMVLGDPCKRVVRPLNGSRPQVENRWSKRLVTKEVHRPRTTRTVGDP